MRVPSNALAPVDTSWFDANPESYLERDDFQEFQKISSVDLRDLFAEDISILQKAQEKIVSQSKIFNEIRNEHSGYGPPFLYYTHNFCFGEELSNHNVGLDKLVLAMNQGDSLRRRHLALSHAILPNVIQEIARENGRAIRLKNLGPGVGLDVINAV